jgi:hypothetical protein
MKTSQQNCKSMLSFTFTPNNNGISRKGEMIYIYKIKILNLLLNLYDLMSVP